MVSSLVKLCMVLRHSVRTALSGLLTLFLLLEVSFSFFYLSLSNRMVCIVSALYGLSRRIKVILRSVLITEFIIMVVSCAFSIPRASFTQGCFATNMPRICLASWYASHFPSVVSVVITIPAFRLASIITQTILFALTMIHFRRSYQQQIQGRIERTLTRDGLWVFGAVSCKCRVACDIHRCCSRYFE